MRALNCGECQVCCRLWRKHIQRARTLELAGTQSTPMLMRVAVACRLSCDVSPVLGLSMFSNDRMSFGFDSRVLEARRRLSERVSRMVVSIWSTNAIVIESAVRSSCPRLLERSFFRICRAHLSDLSCTRGQTPNVTAPKSRASIPR